MTETLIKLSPYDIKELANVYKHHRTEAEPIYSFILTALKWQAKTPEKVLHDFYSLGDAWMDGTFVTYVDFPKALILANTLSENLEILSETFTQTIQRVKLGEKSASIVVHQKYMKIFTDLLTKHRIDWLLRSATHLYRCPKSIALSNTISYLEEYVMRPLKIEDASKINSQWTHRSAKSEEYIRILLEMNGGYGIYLDTEDGRLCAWILRTPIGQLGLLQVFEAHQNRGLGTALVCRLAKDIASEGLDACATITDSNTTSCALFAKCGFQREFPVSFIAVAEK